VDDVMVDGRAVFNRSSMKYSDGVWNALVWFRTAKNDGFWWTRK